MRVVAGIAHMAMTKKQIVILKNRFAICLMVRLLWLNLYIIAIVKPISSAYKMIDENVFLFSDHHDIFDIIKN